ncbi:MAG: HI0074 family nucleotidyltransferase substrate-binding subunit [Elusimicrobia bacterium]|nr:HI0074 family nucleotidyltransferase substrate-binding subunit [Elusimicrobiota bacterium]
MTKRDAQLAQFKKALARLNEALAAPKNDIVRDSAIQRFEFTMDMAWKLVKTCLEEKYGVVCQSPKECFRAAYNQKLLQYDEFWLQLVDMRNQTSHTYKEELAQSVYERLPKAAEYMTGLLKTVEEKCAP